jgi:putative peptide zinc metalloprotease protein
MNAECIRIVPHQVLPFRNGTADESLLKTEDGRYVRVTAGALALVNALNGRTPSEAARTLADGGGPTMSDGDMRLFVEEFLLPSGLVVGQDEADHRRRRSRLQWHLPLIRGAKVSRVGRPLALLFAPPAMLVGGSLFLASVVAYFALGYYRSVSFSSIPLVPTVAVMMASFVAHELGHAAAACRYGSPPRVMGVGLYLARPVLFVDLTDTWELSRRERVVVDSGGIYFQCLLQVLILPIIVLTGSESLCQTYVLLLFAMLINLNPVLKLDGYWIVTDAFGITSPGQKSWSCLKDLVRSLLGKGSSGRQAHSSLSWFVRVYGLLYIVITAAVLARLVWVLPSLLSQLPTKLHEAARSLVLLSQGHMGEGLTLFNRFIFWIVAPIYIGYLLVSYVVVKTREARRRRQRRGGDTVVLNRP